MDKKNYLSKGEQRLWEYIKDKEIIDNELVRQIFPEMPQNKRNKLLHNLYNKGYLKRAKKDLYFNPEGIKNLHKLALEMHEGYIGLNSALRYYNLLDYEDFTIFIMTKDYQKKNILKGTEYSVCFIPLKSLFAGFEKKKGIYISSLEKTLFDSLLKPKFVGLTNITKAIYDSKINWPRFISFFRLTANSSLYQRTGYILEMMKNNTRLKVPSFVFKFLLKRVKNPVKLAPEGKKTRFNKKWKVQDNIGERNILSWWY
jgi:predicted transcriptional regulator of viral defense system